MHEHHDFYRTQFYPSNFVSTLSGRQELKQLTIVLASRAEWQAPWSGPLYQTAGEEMLAYLQLEQGRNTSVGPTLAEAGI